MVVSWDQTTMGSIKIYGNNLSLYKKNVIWYTARMDKFNEMLFRRILHNMIYCTYGYIANSISISHKWTYTNTQKVPINSSNTNLHRLATFFKEVHGLETGYVIKQLQEITENISLFSYTEPGKGGKNNNNWLSISYNHLLLKYRINGRTKDL